MTAQPGYVKYSRKLSKKIKTQSNEFLITKEQAVLEKPRR